MSERQALVALNDCGCIVGATVMDEHGGADEFIADHMRFRLAVWPTEQVREGRWKCDTCKGAA